MFCCIMDLLYLIRVYTKHNLGFLQHIFSSYLKHTLELTYLKKLSVNVTMNVIGQPPATARPIFVGARDWLSLSTYVFTITFTDNIFISGSLGIAE